MQWLFLLVAAECGGRTMRNVLKLLAAAMLVLAPQPVFAQVHFYKWTDAAGNTQYSDQPPPKGTRYVRIEKELTPEISTSPGAAGKSAAEIDFELKRQQQAEAEKRQKEEAKEQQAADKQAQCQRAQGRLKMFQDGGRLMRINAEGEREYMGDEEIREEASKAQQAVDQLCK
jgi:hypothetical protein